MRELLLVLLSGVVVTATAARPPNVVLIMADDMGYECIAANGGTSYATPHIDRLATQGVRFTNCYSTPLCTPSRVQIMTGRYNCFTYDEFGYLSERYRTFGHMMQDAGYRTMIAGKWQLNGISHRDEAMPGRDDPLRPGRAGFDEWSLWQVTQGKQVAERFWNVLIEENGRVLQESIAEKYGPDHFTDYICDFIDRHQARPFFVYYPMVLVHDPFIHTPDSADPLVEGSAAFADMVAYADKLVGRIRDHLESRGLLENTLILFTGDNGTSTRLSSRMGERVIQGGKGQTIDAGIHVPLVAYWQGNTPVGKVDKRLIDFTDFKMTLADLAAVAPSDEGTQDGVSFASALTGDFGPQREWVFCYYEPRWGQNRSHRSAFAMNDRIKVYHDGRVVDYRRDPREKEPDRDGTLSPTAVAHLHDVIARFPDFPAEETPFGSSLKETD